MRLHPAYTALRLTLALTLVTGVAYPLVLYGVAQGAFPRNAGTSLVRDRCNDVVGSALVGQSFTSPQWFHGRPSPSAYDGVASGGSNFGPTNAALADSFIVRATRFRELNGLAKGAVVPIDAITASGSGLDPDISVANAELQIGRIADALQHRHATIGRAGLEVLLRQYVVSSRLSEGRRVNVLLLNLALDSLTRLHACESSIPTTTP